MECLFPAFDYAVIDNNGKASVIPRNESSAFLTKHLRAYGGTGTYQNYQVGRLLRNLSFSGKGLVSKPANPRSIILEGNQFFDESKACALEIHVIKENEMPDNMTQQIIDLQKELAEVKSANEALKAELTTSKTTEYEDTIKELQSSLASKIEEVNILTEAKDNYSMEMKKKEEEMTAMEKKMKDMKEEMAVMKKKEAMMKRKAELEEAGLDSEEASATVSDFENSDDETFAKVVALMKKKAKYMTEEKSVKKDKKDTTMATEDEEVDASQASEKDLDSVEESVEVSIAEAAEENESESLRAVASEWLGSILRSTPKTKDN
jgi:myosin heavy subunit